jgi:hypothetical protein
VVFFVFSGLPEQQQQQPHVSLHLLHALQPLFTLTHLAQVAGCSQAQALLMA